MCVRGKGGGNNQPAQASLTCPPVSPHAQLASENAHSVPEIVMRALCHCMRVDAAKARALITTHRPYLAHVIIHGAGISPSSGLHPSHEGIEAPGEGLANSVSSVDQGGTRGSFSGVIGWLRSLFTASSDLTECLRGDLRQFLPLLHLLRPCLLSYSKEVAVWACRIVARIAFGAAEVGTADVAWQWVRICRRPSQPLAPHA